MPSEVKMREAFAAKYKSDPNDPMCAEMLAYFSDGWEAARVEARAKALEEAAREIERAVDLLELPDTPQYGEDTRHITKRTAAGICTAIRSLAAASMSPDLEAPIRAAASGDREGESR